LNADISKEKLIAKGYSIAATYKKNPVIIFSF